MSDPIERPIAFGRARHLVGVTCQPASAGAAPRPVGVFLNAGIVHRVGPNRMYVRMARALAAAGVSTLRFDLGGVGDSVTPRGEAGGVMDMVRRDIRDAIDFAETGLGAEGVVLIGLCSGADNAIEATAEDPRVLGAVLMDGNVHPTRFYRAYRKWKRLFDPKTWSMLATGSHPALGRTARRITGALPRGPEQEEDDRFLAPTQLPPREVVEERLGGVLDRGVELKYVFTGGLERYNHRRQLFSAYPGVELESRVSLDWRPAADHTFTDRSEQDRLIASVTEWFTSRSFAAAAESRRPVQVG